MGDLNIHNTNAVNILYFCDILSFSNSISVKMYLKKTIKVSIVIYLNIYTYLDIDVYMKRTSKDVTHKYTREFLKD